MNAERWQQIERLFHIALQQEPGQRLAFLAQICAGDELLYEEVTSLLTSHEQSSSFFEDSASALAAEMFGDKVGETIGHYRILSVLGAGGMGSVYLAQDARLGRRIALKLLPMQFTNDKNRLRRFQQEARAASALNHPNILTVYEIEQDDDLHYIATEFIDGPTLRQRMSQERMTIGEALRIAIQVANALNAAHAAGIVHRDIKPENVMLRADGYIKILDFGLAKLTEHPAESLVPDKPEKHSTFNTNPGVVMGTPQYMSPEQARGLLVDGRTDIFSLGIMIYEMVAGRVPFDGVTTSDVIAAILKDEPKSLISWLPEVWLELERIVKRALAKNLDDRYQTISEMSRDLQLLTAKALQDVKLERRTVGTYLSLPVLTSEESGTAETQQRRDTDREAVLVGVWRRYRPVVVMVTSLLLFAVGYFVVRFWIRDLLPNEQTFAFREVKLARLIATGNPMESCISPDGKYVVYAAEDGGKQSLWMRPVAAADSVQLTSPDYVQYSGITFSPNGDYFNYVMWDQRESVDGMYRLPTQGGVPQRVLADVDSAVSFSPDGKHITFVRTRSSLRECYLLIANADGTDEKVLAKRGTRYFSFNKSMPAWSPDGRVIVSGAKTSEGSELERTLVEVDVVNGSEKRITPQTWAIIEHIKWLKNGDGLILTAREGVASPAQVWHVSYPAGQVRRITNDLNDYHSLSLTDDSATLAVVQVMETLNNWVTAADGVGKAKQISSGIGMEEIDGLSWTPDGNLLYASYANGNWDIWTMNRNGGQQRQLTSDVATDVSPTMSPDGQYIVFASDRNGTFNLWRMKADGTGLIQLTSGKGHDVRPRFSPDGRWIIYQGFGGARSSIWKIPVEGGNPELLTDMTIHTLRPDVSPDGQIAFYFMDRESWRLGLIRSEVRTPVRILNIGPTHGRVVRWTPNGKALSYVDNREGVSNIWIRPLDGRSPRQVTNFISESISNFDWSRDGKWLAISRGAKKREVVMINLR